MELEDDLFAHAQGSENCQQLFPWEIFLVEQLHSAGGIFAADNLGARFDPFAEHFATHVAWSDFHARIISHPFHFSRYADGVSVYFCAARIETGGWDRCKPHRRPDAVTLFLYCLVVQILLFRKPSKGHRTA